MSIVCSASFVSLSRVSRRLFWAVGGAILACAGTGQSAYADDAIARTYFERSYVLAANSRCNLFAPKLSRALEAAAMQTRGTLLRQGYEPEEVGQIRRQAIGRSDTVQCNDSELMLVRERIDNAFGLWTRAARINFPARGNGWAVDRFSSTATGWRMVQKGRVGASPVHFGLAGNGPDDVQPMAVVSFVGRSRPYAARVVMRDKTILPRPYVVRSGVADVPPSAARKVVFAARQSVAPRSLLQDGQRQGEAWVFDPQLVEVLSGLDPRETFLIEFLFRDDTVARVRMEAGDIGAARSFLSMGPVS